jgi:ABC-2 type transport system permease protein
MMKELILKDIRLLKIINIVTILVGAIFVFGGMNAGSYFLSQFFFGYLIFLLVYVVSIILTGKEVKTQGDIILNSLPLKRREIVKGRYLTMLLYALGIGVFVLVLGNLIHIFMGNTFDGAPPNIFTILLGSSFVLLFFSLYLPFQYYNIGKVQLFSSLFYMVFILGPYFLSRYQGTLLETDFLQMLFSLDLVVSSFIVFAFSCLIYFLSYKISVKIYKMKEF